VSTRPGAPEIPEEEERDRLIPCIEAVHSKFPEITISADTYRSRIADEALQAGASIINDVSAGVIDSAIIDVAKKWNAPYVLMHMQGRPGNMQKNPQYKDVVDDLMAFFTNRIEFLRGKGLRDIIIDPGFGFGKRLHHNYRLLHYLHVFQVFEVPILVGLSRKSMIHRPLDARPEEVLAETSALHLMALNQGAKILRVHDIDAAMRVVKLWDELQKAVKKEA
jgi:dihydropteroate synthase